VRAKRAKPARVYPAESDPRQANGVDRFARDIQRIAASLRMGHEDESARLAREFGPWVRGDDGRWQRDRRKR